MKKLGLLGFTILLAGCGTSRQERSSLTAEQAGAAAVGLANDQAMVRYHCRPFSDRRPARFLQGQWVWSDRAGYKHGDIEAGVELAANGSTNQVVLRFLDSSQSREF